MTKAKWVGVGLLIFLAFFIICGAVGVVWYFGPDPKDALAAVSRHIGPDPKSTVVSSDPSKWESELAPAIKKLPDDEKRLVGAYLVRRRMAEAFGVKDFGKEGMTVGQMIEAERAFEKEQANKESEAKALKEKVTAEKEAVQRQINDILTVALISKSFRKADYKSGSYSDEITMELAFANKGTKDIAGVKGTTVFKDMFGDVIKQINLSYDDGIPAGKNVSWLGSLHYNQFESSDTKLRNTDMTKLSFSFIPDTVVFKDGTRIKASTSE
jgi:hypothetical protein